MNTFVEIDVDHESNRVICATKPKLIKKPPASPLSLSLSPPKPEMLVASPTASFKKKLLQKEGSFEKLKKQYDINIEDIAHISGADASEIRLFKALNAMKDDEDIDEDISRIG